MADATVSLTPTSVSGLLCNSSPLAAAIAMATTEVDANALASVVRGQHAPQSGSLWAADMYDVPQQPVEALVALPLQSEVSSTAAIAPTAEAPDDCPSISPPPSSGLEQQQEQQQLHVSVMSAGSTEESGSAPFTAVPSSDIPPGQPFAHTATASVSRLRKNVSWQCGLCGYYVLAMDQDGTPLSFATSAFGNVLPLMCPRCRLSHTSWQASTPFNEQGDHLNLPTTYSNRYVAPSAPSADAQLIKGSASTKEREAALAGGEMGGDEGTRFLHSALPSTLAGVGVGNTLLSHRAAAASLSITSRQLRNTGAAASDASLQRRAFYCGHCNRRLLRVDANGELVDMNRNKDGSICPIQCPGCGEMHSDWVVKPYAVHR
ncbi:hypothetical protein ABL78_5283 [Leptomonas seymouri]|uniref:Uncharacterized protein n=1 Tax=Leptomonas seymouri TaxID=5684 RepID=A0A0N1PDM6_LEPSE|nr:hypothetical protein ABL78_5283 [Leptomonas seymouri]|eukprot:KPI85662.1 hypothetical protein ABL78_5283 [Leptomonas seymouri]